MQALVYLGPHQLEWQEWPDPVPGAGEVLIESLAVGICGSDLHGYSGESSRRKPGMVMGHELTGRVVGVGPGASDTWVGTRVVIQPLITCGMCEECRAERRNRCHHRRFLGANINGGMCDLVTVPEQNLIPLARNVSLTVGTLTEPLAVALHAVHQGGEISGKTVLICGSGPIGLLILVAARQSGARLVMMTEPLADRREAAGRLGADAVFDPGLPGWQSELEKLVGRTEVDITFDAAGIQPTFQTALEMSRRGGRLVALSGWRSVTVDLSMLVNREIDLRGSFNFVPEEFIEAYRWLEQGLFDPNLLITAVQPWAEAISTFEQITCQPGRAIKTVLTKRGSLY